MGGRNHNFKRRGIRMKDYNKYVGRYFERNLNRGDGEAEVFKIEKFDGEHFIVTEYGLHLGFSTLELNLKRLTSFIEKDNFKEITKDKYETITYLCIDPYVTDWADVNRPRYYRILKNNKLEIIERN